MFDISEGSFSRKYLKLRGLIWSFRDFVGTEMLRSDHLSDGESLMSVAFSQVRILRGANVPASGSSRRRPGR
jgi:hypothetical protein